MLDGRVCSSLETAHSRNLAVGSMIKATIKLTNNSPSIMPASYLVLEPYAFSQEGRTIVRNLTGRMLYSGSLVTNLPQVSGRGGWAWLKWVWHLGGDHSLFI